MQKPNLNSESNPPYRKRQCLVYKPNDYFECFDRSQYQVITNYEKQAEAHMVKSLSILIDNLRGPSKSKSLPTANIHENKPLSKDNLISFAKNVPNFKKNLPQIIFEEDQYTNPEKEIKQMIVFEKTGKKVDKSLEKLSFCKMEKEIQPNPIQMKKHSKLLESLKKLTISDEQEELKNEIQNFPHLNNRQQSIDTNLLQIEESIEGRSLSDLINQTSQHQKIKNYSPIQSEDSQYELTDYSSNESSNGDDNDYQERFAYDSNEKPLFGGLFGQGGKSIKQFNKGVLNFSNGSDDSIPQQQPKKLNFKPIMDSPKKSKTKKKRVYVNKKKVPRWAQNLKLIADVYGTDYQRNLRKQFKQIFGICIVENMQTNPIFNRNDVYNRSSTVKWTQQNFDPLF